MLTNLAPSSTSGITTSAAAGVFGVLPLLPRSWWLHSAFRLSGCSVRICHLCTVGTVDLSLSKMLIAACL